MSTDDTPRRVLTEEELAMILAAFKHPEFRAQMLADHERSRMVEVDNPLRREVRYRRGTEPEVVS